MTKSSAEIIGQYLRQQKLTLPTAESCSGGLLAHYLTNIPGSSDYFLGATDRKFKPLCTST